ncbi:MAG: ABC transporter permease [Gaiellaceae bacterium]
MSAHASGATGRWAERLSWERLRGLAILIPFALLFGLLTLKSSHFATQDNLLSILDQQSATLIIAAAGTLVLVAGGIDLSVGATYALAAVVTAQVGQHHGATAAFAMGIAAGLVVGVLNGLVITILRINALIVTLAAAFIVGGFANLIAKGNLLVLYDDEGNIKEDFARLANTEWFGVKTSIWIAAAVVVVLAFLLAATTAGRYMYAAGGNAEAARLAGVRVNWIRILTFALSGTAAGLAGVIDTSRVGSAQASSDNTTLAFTVLAAIVVGGTSILGGEGAVWRSVVGVLLIAFIANGYVLLGKDPLYQQITTGAILLAAVAIDALARRRS